MEGREEAEKKQEKSSQRPKSMHTDYGWTLGFVIVLPMPPPKFSKNNQCLCLLPGGFNP